jgi:purine-nucleoside phosphorylase
MDFDPAIPGSLLASGAETALILGSGLGTLASGLEPLATVEFSEVSGLPVSAVPGHAGRFSAVRLAGQPLLIVQGRVHLYEGWTAEETTRSIRFLHRLGIKNLIITNAAGSLNPDFAPGGWMLIADHLNLTGRSPLHGDAGFIDMSNAYCPTLRERFRSAAAALRMDLHEGIYAAVPGPQYETPAEVRMLRLLGADAVGMSTVLEVIQARALGIRVAALSCLSNWAAGLSPRPIGHDEVVSVGRGSAGVLLALLEATLAEI